MPTPVDTARVVQLLEEGAQLVDVLPAETFRQEHLPGAVNVPIQEITDASAKLDASKPAIVYCYDYQCDLSSRGAHLLEHLGFAEVYDYVASKAAWLAEGLPGAGLLSDDERAKAFVRADVPRVKPDATIADIVGMVGDWEVVVVVDADEVVLGSVRSDARSLPQDVAVTAVMQSGPPTVRPSIPIRELAKSMDENGESRILVTKLDGTLLGLVRRADLDAG
jgi:rhodanese-related sulfurtransferase/CBS domain-containing protein